MSTIEESAAGAPADATIEVADFSARNRIVIGVLLVSTFIVILNETIMSVAIPHLMTDLGVTASAAQWLTAAFMLTMAVVIPVTGFLIQRINTRPIFMLAMAMFSTGTLVCAISPGLEMLIFGRVVQAVGTAIMLPLLMTTVMTLVPPESRGKTMGNISIVISVAPAIGPTISGIILNTLDWRWMFILVLPVALTGLVIGARLIQNVTEPRYAPLDYLSVVLSALGFGGFVYGLSTLGEMSHAVQNSVPGWIPLVLGAAMLVLFVWRQIILQKQEKALLDLRTFKAPIFTMSVVMMGISMMALFGTIILLPIYMQNVLGLDALRTGMLLLPGGLVMGLMAPMVGRWYDKVGPRPLLVPGAIIVSAVLWSLTMVGQETSQYAILAGHVIISFGLSLLFTPLFTASLSAVPMKLYSHASAIIGTIQQVAGAAGVALFVALMTLQAGNLSLEGLDEVASLAGGIRVGFMCGAIISLFSIAAAFFITKPEEHEGGGHGMHGGH